jgi:hypothetical protein
MYTASCRNSGQPDDVTFIPCIFRPIEIMGQLSQFDILFPCDCGQPDIVPFFPLYIFLYVAVREHLVLSYVASLFGKNLIYRRKVTVFYTLFHPNFGNLTAL